ncbi:MAG: hypothetical protein FGM37_02790 [Phycisphaerales bacterium]|nr:hypothetical protein [Phycisphaerales bacterium]
MPSRPLVRAVLAALSAAVLSVAVSEQEAMGRSIMDKGKGASAEVTQRVKEPEQIVPSRSPSDALAPRTSALKDPSRLRIPVHPTKGTLEHTGRLIVKFADGLGVRASRRLGSALHSDGPTDLSFTNATLARYGATVRQAIDLDTDVIDGLLRRAFERSGRVQPDLRAMMIVEGIGEHSLVSAAQQLLALPEVQWVEIERKTGLAGGGGGCDGCGPPCGQDCRVENPGPFCGDSVCCELVGGVRPICTTPADEGGRWDEVCAALANLLCTPSAFGGGGYDTCLQPDPLPIFYEEAVVFGGSCFVPRAGVGCVEAECCRNTCFADVTCCTIAWDEECAALAMGIEECFRTSGYNFPGGKPTGNPFNPNPQSTSPLFDQQMLEIPQPPFAAPGSAPLALYTTARRAPDPYGGPNPPPPDLGPFEQFADVTRYRGGGLDLNAFAFLQNQFPGGGPFFNGRTITIGVVEPSALVDHEDLAVNPDGSGGTKILVEPGQTPLIICDQTVPPPTFSGSFYTAPQHGTAVLGVLAANVNEFGVSGIAPEATIRFYPTESVEAQGRLLTALTNATSQLSTPTATDPEPGNVILAPIQESGQPIWTSPSRAQVMNVGIDAGVTYVVPAGNAAQPVLEPEDEIGALAAANSITVGGCNPGFEASEPAVIGAGLNYCRTGISNFDTSGAGLVTVAGWGSGVCTLGYGDLFCGEIASVSDPCQTNLLRTYTARFGGTSAGAAQIAGVAALVQAFSKQIYEGLPLSPQNIRALLLAQSSIYPQCGTPGLPGTPDPAWVGDTLIGPGDASIGGFPNMRRIGVSIVSGTIGDENLFGGNDCTYKIICGTGISGNTFSIRELDRKFLRARTARPGRGQSASGLGPPVYYPPVSRILDLQVVRPTQLSNPQELLSVNVQVAGRPASSGTVIVSVFLYNARFNRWTWIGAQPMADVDAPLVFGLGPCSESQDFLANINGTQSIAARVIAYPLGSSGQVEIWYDRILIDFNNPLIPIPPPCGP